jgi:hypothetical protein
MCEGDEALCQSTSKSWHHDKELSPGKRRHRLKVHLADYDTRLEKEAFVLARRYGG